MQKQQLINLIKTDPESIEFNDVIKTIDHNYEYKPARFTNGDVVNESGTNEGSCKIFSFAQLNDLKEQETLACFGNYYRKDVLDHPQGTDHANIRTFIQLGWEGISFDSQVLSEK
ncbi:MAG: HopJ type III effector protein [Gammaproteobacteria bacterium]